MVRVTEKSDALAIKSERLCRVFIGANNNSRRSTVGRLLSQWSASSTFSINIQLCFQLLYDFRILVVEVSSLAGVVL